MQYSNDQLSCQDQVFDKECYKHCCFSEWFCFLFVTLFVDCIIQISILHNVSSLKRVGLKFGNYFQIKYRITQEKLQYQRVMKLLASVAKGHARIFENKIFLIAKYIFFLLKCKFPILSDVGYLFQQSPAQPIKRLMQRESWANSFR